MKIAFGVFVVWLIVGVILVVRDVLKSTEREK
jgi:hypothetical protein